MKLHFYSIQIPKYFIFLSIFFYSFDHLYAKNIENTELFQLFEKEYNYISIDKKKFNKSQEDYYYKTAEEFLLKNITDDIDKNLTVYSIAAEYLSMQGVPIDEIDFNYVEEFYDNFLQASFKKQCQTGLISTGVFLSYSYGVTEHDFVDDFFKCRNFINDTKFGLLILNLVTSRSFFVIKNDESLKNILIELQILDLSKNDLSRSMRQYYFGDCDISKLFLYKSYSNLIFYYSNQDDIEGVIDSYEKSKKITNICKTKLFNKIFEIENAYRYYFFQIDNIKDYQNKINLFYEFDAIAKQLFSDQIEDLYSQTIYLDLYILNIINEYELNKDENLLMEQIQFASDKALLNARSQYFLSTIKEIKNDYDIQESPTIGLINEENDFFKNSKNKQELWDKLLDLVYEKKNYEQALLEITKYEEINGPISYPNDYLLINYKWDAYHYDGLLTEAIQFQSEMINEFASKSFKKQGLNFFNNSKNPEISKIIKESSRNILDSLFLLQYGEGYELNEGGSTIVFPDEYLQILPQALETLLFIGQLSDLNEANHSVQYLKLKDIFKNIALSTGYENLPYDIDQQLRNIFEFEKQFLQYSSENKSDLEELARLKNNIQSSYKKIYDSKLWLDFINKNPEAQLNSFNPLNTGHLITKLRPDEQLIYVKEFEELIYVIGISHEKYDWLKIEGEELDNLRKNLINYKLMISDPNIPFDMNLSQSIYQKLLWKFITTESMQFTNKIYFINSSNLIDIPLDSLQFILPDGEFDGDQLIDYFAFTYLPSIDYFQKTTKDKLIFEEAGFNIEPVYEDSRFIGFKLINLEFEPFFGHFYEGDIITSVDGQDINYLSLFDFLHINTKVKGYKQKLTVLRNNQKTEITIDNLRFYSKKYEYDFIGFGDPVFNNNQNQTEINLGLLKLRNSSGSFEKLDQFYASIPELKETREEIINAKNSILDIPKDEAFSNLNFTGNTKTFLGEEANEKNFYDLQNTSTRFLTFATHAISSKDQSFLTHPSLILSRTIDKDNDGLLSSLEVAEMNIESDLTILSACNTFSANEDSDFKLSGFANSFLIAGTRNIMLSRWSVPSEQTAELMNSFYKSPILTLDYSVALRLAKMEIREKYPHPFYWSSFFIIGK